MTNIRTAGRQVIEEVGAWPGVQVDLSEPGEAAFRFGSREMGHLHGDHVAHFGFPKGLWAKLMEQGRVVPHPIAKAGWAARRMRNERDVRDVIELFHLNYERMQAGSGLREGAQTP